MEHFYEKNINKNVSDIDEVMTFIEEMIDSNLFSEYEIKMFKTTNNLILEFVDLIEYTKENCEG